MDLTQIIDPIDDSEFEDEEYEEDGSQTKTMMWDKDQIDPETTDTNKTVVINDDEIQSLLEEDKGPRLKREVHRGSARKSDRDTKKNCNYRCRSDCGHFSGSCYFWCY